MKIKLGDPILRPFTDEQLEKLSRRDLIILAKGEQKIRAEYEAFILEVQERQAELLLLAAELEERVFDAEGSLCRVRARMFSPSSERSPGRRGAGRLKKGGEKGPVTRLPSERYPTATIIEKEITIEQEPACKCCGGEMEDSGMEEIAEHLTIIPKQVVIVREHRHKYRCRNCHGDIVTAPPVPRVVPGGSYSDEMICDATLSKYCDLIPMERYCQMAKRQGFEGLPPQSLIGTGFKLADFLSGAYELTKQETLDTAVLLADETTHRMLEGDKTAKWFLWGFSKETSCFYECHPTRSGDVASSVLAQSNCQVLMSDAYSGYAKAIREANEKRAKDLLAPILVAYCNSHARREFAGSEAPPEAQYMVDQYKKIYKLEAQVKLTSSPEEKLKLRAAMRPFFEDMKQHATSLAESFSSKSGLGKGFNYFLKYYDGLTLFLTNLAIAIDNNASERLLRGHVVGRKTWYGTHSKEGAKASAIHFTLIESCKLNGVNPRAYYRETIKRIHAKQTILTPWQFSQAGPPARESS